MSLDSHFINAITSEIEPQYTVDKKGNIDSTTEIPNGGQWCSSENFLVIAGLLGVHPSVFFSANPLSHEFIKEGYDKLKRFRHALHKSSSALDMIKGVAFNQNRAYVTNPYEWETLKTQVRLFSEKDFVDIYNKFKYYAHVPYEINIVSTW